jgi:hypothetical protein
MFALCSYRRFAPAGASTFRHHWSIVESSSASSSPTRICFSRAYVSNASSRRGTRQISLAAQKIIASMGKKSEKIHRFGKLDLRFPNPKGATYAPG